MSAPGAGAPTRGASITICGSGNAAHALAVVASQYHDVDVDWLVGSDEKADLLRQGLATGLQSTGAIVARAGRIRRISSDPAEVIPDAGLVLIVVPAFGHAAVLRRIAPHLLPGSAVGCMPARGGFEFEAERCLDVRDDVTIFGLQTLPWSTRVTTFGKAVHIGAVKQSVPLASLPGAPAQALAERLSRLLGVRVAPIDSFLALTLGNPGQFIHPGLMYGHFRAWNGEEFDDSSVPMLYADATDEIGDIVNRLSDEAIRVATRIASATSGTRDLHEAVISVHEWLKLVYGHVTSDTSTVGSCFRTGPIQARKAPMFETADGRFAPNFQYRYLSEDVPFGLVATRALATVAGVATPMLDEVIGWAQAVLGKSYLVDDELNGCDLAELPIPQNFGIVELADLVDWYEGTDSSRRLIYGYSASARR